MLSTLIPTQKAPARIKVQQPENYSQILYWKLLNRSCRFRQCVYCISMYLYNNWKMLVVPLSTGGESKWSGADWISCHLARTIQTDPCTLDYVTHRPSLKVRIVFVWPVSHEWNAFRVMSQCPSLTDAYSEAESSVLMFCSAKWFLPPAKAVVLKYHLGRMVSGDCWQNCNWSWKRFLWCVSIQLQMLNWGPRRQLHVLALSWISWAWTRRI